MEWVYDGKICRQTAKFSKTKLQHPHSIKWHSRSIMSHSVFAYDHIQYYGTVKSSMATGTGVLQQRLRVCYSYGYRCSTATGTGVLWLRVRHATATGTGVLGLRVRRATAMGTGVLWLREWRVTATGTGCYGYRYRRAMAMGSGMPRLCIREWQG